MAIAITNGVSITGGCLLESYLNTYIASLSPQIWLKFDDAYTSGTVWSSSSWINSGSASVSPTIVGGNVTGTTSFVPLGNKAVINYGGSPATTATFTAQYTPNANTTYYNQTITMNMTINTNSDFRSATQGNWPWHQGATAVSGNQGLSLAYSPDASGNDIFYVQYFNGAGGGWLAAYMGIPVLLQNNTNYNITLVYSATGGTGNGYVKGYINGVSLGATNLSYAVPNTGYAARFGARGLSDTSVEVTSRISMDNCLLWNRELTAQEIFTLSALSLASPCDDYFSNVSLLLPMNGANNSTTFTDYSPSPKTVTPSGDTKISFAQSKWNLSSGYFDGTGDYLNIPTNIAFAFGTGDFTIEMWLYRVGSGQQHLYEGRNGTTTNTILLYLNASNQLTYYANGAVRISTTSVPTVNTWVHIAVCRSGTSTKLFMDGVQVGSTYTDTLNYAAPTTTLYIGTNDVASGSYLNGYLADLRVTKGVARYTANFTPPTASFPIQGC